MRDAGGKAGKGTERSRKQATEDVTQRVIAAIKDHQAQHGYLPSIRELATACTVSVNTMHRLLLKLEQRGRIEMTPGQARTIRVLDAESETLNKPRVTLERVDNEQK